MISALRYLACCGAFSLSVLAQQIHFGNSAIEVTLTGEDHSFWTLSSHSSRQAYTFSAPVFAIDGTRYPAALSDIKAQSDPVRIASEIAEYRFEGTFRQDPSLKLELIFRVASNSPVLRFRYVLHCSQPRALTRSSNADSLRYLSASFASLPNVTEVHLSEFNDLTHSYTPSERTVSAAAFSDGLSAMGPILVGEDTNRGTLLIAYEHGSTIPDAFLQFHLSSTRDVTLDAVKGNYVPGQKLRDYETIWMDAAAASGGLDATAAAFRTFVLRYMSPYGTSRTPYIFYNTWNYQERNKWWNGNSYLESMTPGRILSEIDVAHRMGIEVFVMDTGWYEKTGDWQVSRKRFPGDLAPIRERLNRYGMKLGLWFNPTAAAISSRIYLSHAQSVMSWKGEKAKPRPIWETEESYPMCLVSNYGDAFADELIRIARDYGVRYFKWDAVGQYGCDSPLHLHGASGNTRDERADSYAFQLPLAMARIVRKVTAAYPDAIIDFDVTESGRAFGLAFLAVGKYFLINNGPYLFNYDLPIDKARQNWNLFFYPGPARTWICRLPLSYDRWIPSVLLLMHFLPDDPRSSQMVNLGSLVLGQNGIWGDLPKVSEAGVDVISTVLSKYKQVRNDMAAAFPLRSGAVAGVPEIHEKISQATGRGGVVLFSTSPGKFSYITQSRPAKEYWATPKTTVTFDGAGHANITADGAAIVFFGSR